jgi:hypothetical protein
MGNLSIRLAPAPALYIDPNPNVQIYASTPPILSMYYASNEGIMNG